MFSLLAHHTQVIKYFKIGYYALSLLIVSGIYFIFFQEAHLAFFYQLGLIAARSAVVLFVIVLLPGIARRFHIRHSFLYSLTHFRRYLGIATYLFMLVHFIFVGLPNLLAYSLLKAPVFMIFGLSALLILLPLFLTSNDLSVRRLGSWWTRIHQLIYLSAWFIFGHLILQGWTIWSILIGVAAFLETISLISSYFKTHKNP